MKGDWAVLIEKARAAAISAQCRYAPDLCPDSHTDVMQRRAENAGVPLKTQQRKNEIALEVMSGAWAELKLQAGSALRFVNETLAAHLERAPALRALGEDALRRCGVRFVDLIDSIQIAPDSRRFSEMGWRETDNGAWKHADPSIPDLHANHAKPAIILRMEQAEVIVDRVDAGRPAENRDPARPSRGVIALSDGEITLQRTHKHTTRILRRARLHLQEFRTRCRHFRTVAGGLAHTRRLIAASVADLGANWTAQLFLRAEREYWANHCDAGILLKRQQEQYGIGFGNIDVHVYESSREYASLLLEIFDQMGFFPTDLACEPAAHTPRTTLVLRNEAGLWIWLDMDVALERNAPLFGARLSPPVDMGAADFWCALHGESILQGGLSAVVGRYACEMLLEALLASGVCNLNVSRDPVRYLTALGAERAVNRRRVEALKRAGQIDEAAAEHLQLFGARASFLAAYDSSHMSLAAPAELHRQLWTAISRPRKARSSMKTPRLRPPYLTLA